MVNMDARTAAFKRGYRCTTRYIQTLVERHESVRQLVDNQWLYLYAWQPENGQIQRLFQGVWAPCMSVLVIYVN